MNPTIMTARVTDQHLQLVNEPLIASGGVDVIQIRFEFCGLWNGCGKTAVFYRDPEEVYHAPITDGVVTVPHEVLTDEGYFFLGVMGSASNIRTTEVVKVEVARGAITTATAEPEEPTPDIYQQLLAAYGSLEQAVAKDHGRLDELVAMRGDGQYTYEFSHDTKCIGTITSTGANAVMHLELDELTIPANGYKRLGVYEIPVRFAPLECELSVFFRNQPDLEIEFLFFEHPTNEDLVQGSMEIRNLSNADIDLITTEFYAYYPLANVYIGELADLRVDAKGQTYECAGAAVRQQISFPPTDMRFRNTYRIRDLAPGVVDGDAVNKKQLDEAVAQATGADVIDDTKVGTATAWSSKATVDRLCPPIAESGAVVTCEPVEGYPLTVTAPDATTVRRCGKNLFNYKDWVAFANRAQGGAVEEVEHLGRKCFSYKLYRTNTAEFFRDIRFKPNTRYTIKLAFAFAFNNNETYPAMSAMVVYYTDGTYLQVNATTATSNSFTEVQFTTAVGKSIDYLAISRFSAACTIYLPQDSCVIEEGISATYEEYNGGEFAPGATIPALPGVNTLYADSGIVTVTGRADPVAIIEKLTQAVLAMGANV